MSWQDRSKVLVLGVLDVTYEYKNIRSDVEVDVNVEKLTNVFLQCPISHTNDIIFKSGTSNLDTVKVYAIDLMLDCDCAFTGKFKVNGTDLTFRGLTYLSTVDCEIGYAYYDSTNSVWGSNGISTTPFDHGYFELTGKLYYNGTNWVLCDGLLLHTGEI